MSEMSFDAVSHDAALQLRNNRVYRVVSEDGVCDLSRSMYCEAEGQVRDFSYDQLSPEEAMDLAGELVKAALAAKNFHAGVVSQLRGHLNGSHDDGEA